MALPGSLHADKMKLSGADQYNPNMLSQLEKFATEEISQASTEKYSLAANLALLRIYVTQPERTNTQLLSQLLVRAITRLPEKDFATLLHLIPERLQEEQPIASLIALMQHLDGARFQSFWSAADSCRDILNTVPGFTEAIRTYILGAVHSTCRKVSRQTLAEYLRLDGTALDQLIDSRVKDEDWKVIKGGNGKLYIELPRLKESIAKEQSSQSSAFRFEQLAPLLASA